MFIVQGCVSCFGFLARLSQPALACSCLESALHGCAGGLQNNDEVQRRSRPRLAVGSVPFYCFPPRPPWAIPAVERRCQSGSHPRPEVIAADIAADLEVALEQFAMIAEDLKREASTNTRSPLSLSNITLDHSRYNTL